jgi:hypothetical protein
MRIYGLRFMICVRALYANASHPGGKLRVRPEGGRREGKGIVWRVNCAGRACLMDGAMASGRKLWYCTCEV